MSTSDTTITLNLYARDINEWKIFVVEQMMCSHSWPEDVKLLRPSLRTEEKWLRRAIVPKPYSATGKMVEIILKDGVLSREEISGTQGAKDTIEWYEKLKMLWKGNGIIPRWDKETCRRENGEREFMATMRDPPFVLQAPRKLDGWEKTRLDEGSWRWAVGVGTEVVGWAWGV
ncbi:hypothetical protein HYFRA_00012982 [Hymenoscyphus fraxineus]|uniref:Uncharacterized protein n=1 Tax=Hymenoscyphus fraxineus TaxID=746836 RepID=A0A9N9PM27_9HELO|nr:hypothetical protein HYFRA_00012982 [Hymenoscyphus fraxineus]